MELSWSDAWEFFSWAILAALVTGVICPLIGSLLLVRRTGFYGVALPQFAAAGIALGWAIPVWLTQLGLGDYDLETMILEDPHGVDSYLLVTAGLVTFLGLAFLLALSKRTETETGRVAAGFAIASAATVLLAMVSPHGKEVIDQLMRGEILTTDRHDFETIAISYGLVALVFYVYQRDILLVSFDRELALVMGKAVRRYDGLMLAMIGVTVTVGVLIVGPIVLFGQLVMPPLAANAVARSMRGFYSLAILLGVVSGMGGVWLSFRMDWPLGPSVCVIGALLLAVVTLVGGRKRT